MQSHKNSIVDSIPLTSMKKRKSLSVSIDSKSSEDSVGVLKASKAGTETELSESSLRKSKKTFKKARPIEDDADVSKKLVLEEAIEDPKVEEDTPKEEKVPLKSKKGEDEEVSKKAIAEEEEEEEVIPKKKAKVNEDEEEEETPRKKISVEEEDEEISKKVNEEDDDDETSKKMKKEEEEEEEEEEEYDE